MVANQGCTTDVATGPGSERNATSSCAPCSARSTVATRSSIRVPVNVISEDPFFLLHLRPSFYFSWPLWENSTTECLAKASGKIFTRHAVPSPHRAPSRFSGQTQTLSAARIFALRDRGFRSISSSDAITGFFVSRRKSMSFAPARIASLTILSSSE
jgi:hypothetical protein